MPYNRLCNEKSPYLLQHAQNPVDWYPWGEEAFEKAHREDKPVFLSIGYSTCHWCHVMERESFENLEIASLLNDSFVNIKVDREERPEIDAVYMKVCQVMTQSGGWPLTIMMNPDKQPFFAATYIPDVSRYGRVGLSEMIPAVKKLWQERRADLLSDASEITRALLQSPTTGSQALGEETMHRAYQSLLTGFDRTYGGFGQAPKFPSPHNFFFLLRYWKRTGVDQALRIVEHTMQNMRRGGIYDQIGFGFHRYATDERWTLPHFEKMLYDQALIALAFIELYQATGKKEYEILAREIFTYVLRDMTDDEGGFYCAEDADSEGVEGKFYTWSPEEVRGILTEGEAALFLSEYRHEADLYVQGMQELPEGQFIPHLKGISDVDEEAITTDGSGKMESIRKKLFAYREKRIHPHKDDKILTDWNGLMIASLARGAQVFNEPEYVMAALRAMGFITKAMQDNEGRLLHRYRQGQAAITGNVDDYSFLIWALLELYETTFEARYLVNALEYQSHLFARFRDERNGGFFFTPDDAETLLMRPKELYDGAVPSGNSVAYMNALRLSRITGNAGIREKAEEIYRAFCTPVYEMPSAFTQFLCGLDFALGPSSEVIIAGDINREDTREMIRTLRESFVPNKVVVFLPDGPSRQDIDGIAPYLKSYSCDNGRATAYVCSNYSCSLATSDPAEMIALLMKCNG